jgi:oligosaccharyl transferase complex subunit OST4
MITDSQLYSLALFLGCAAMLMIVLYHFLEVNAVPDDQANDAVAEKVAAQQQAAAEKN